MRADGARALAGGTDLIPQMREGRRQVAAVIDLKKIPELTRISVGTDGSLELGAAASASVVARHPTVAATYPAVARSARLIGSLQVQNRASLGGNICNAAPSADAVPALICHQASVRVAGSNGPRDAFARNLRARARQNGSRAGRVHDIYHLAARSIDIGGCVPALHSAPGNGHRRSRSRRLGSSRCSEQNCRGTRGAGVRGPTPIRATSAEQHPQRETVRGPVRAAGRLAAGDRVPSPTRGARGLSPIAGRGSYGAGVGGMRGTLRRSRSRHEPASSPVWSTARAHGARRHARHAARSTTRRVGLTGARRVSATATAVPAR